MQRDAHPSPTTTTTTTMSSAPARAANGSTLIDPVTHRELLVSEVESFPSEDRRTPGNNSSEGLAALLRQEATRDYWKQPEYEQQYRKQTAAVVAGAAGVGGLASLGLTSLFRISINRNELLVTGVGIVGCAAIALVAGASVLQAKLKPPSLGEESHSPTPSPSRTPNPKDLARSPQSATLNHILSSLWPIVNPALFTSLADMLEDALQSSLPTFIHGVRIADLGQGSEPLRVLGMRALTDSDNSDTMDTDLGQYVNLELAVAYHAQDVGSSDLKQRARNIHVLLEFYCAGGIVLPVWVEITGILASVRLRLELTPNPPFLAEMTMTFLGLPKVTLQCTPLSKNFLNIMDVPGLSKWLQSAIDDAVGTFVAPRSLTLDLKQILSGGPKRDTDALGVLYVKIRRANDFRNGDEGKFWQNKESKYGDPYVNIGWGKWGKTIWSTRIIENSSQPVWEEIGFVLVTAAETNAREKLRLQLWDADRLSADDFLGEVEVPLGELMRSPDTRNKIQDRKDTLGTGNPGTIEWSVGYMTKTKLEHHIEDAEELGKRIAKETEDKLREAMGTTNSQQELEQEIKDELKDQTIALIAGTPPSKEWVTGILSIQVEQITGLEVVKVRESGVRNGDEAEDNGDLPSAYCTIIINDERIYKTRTKMKSNKPFFNAGTERLVKNWEDTTVIIAVRDWRLHEKNPILGVVVLPLKALFKNGSQVTDSFPLVGGVGVGRLRFAAAWRSVQLKLPYELQGWPPCTIEIGPHATACFNLPPDLATCQLRLETGIGEGQKRKLFPNVNGGWNAKRDRPLAIAFKNRFCDSIVLKLRKRSLGIDSTEAWGIVWLKDLLDREETEVEVPIQKGDHDALQRERRSVTEPVNVVGRITLTLKAWPGLSGYHQKLAAGDASLADVMQVLECANKSIKEDVGTESIAEDTMSSSSSSSSSSDDSDTPSTVSRLKDKIKPNSEINRKHRGLMQWSGVRKLEWIRSGVEVKKDVFEKKLKATIRHQQRDGELEREA